jgi:uncharacterized membrane protein YvbJ
MTKREERVINAFIECVEKGEYSYEYAVTLLEDNNKYGYLTDEAKEVFYNYFENKKDIAEEVIVEEELSDEEIIVEEELSDEEITVEETEEE